MNAKLYRQHDNKRQHPILLDLAAHAFAMYDLAMNDGPWPCTLFELYVDGCDAYCVPRAQRH